MKSYCGNCHSTYTHKYGEHPDVGNEYIKQSIFCANWFAGRKPDCTDLEYLCENQLEAIEKLEGEAVEAYDSIYDI